MPATPKEILRRQLDIAWQLTSYHLGSLTTEECLWRPAAVGLHVQQDAAGEWRADWPEREDYDIGPPSIAWITWHMIFWWSMAIDHAMGQRSLGREDVTWPGSADGVRATIARLHGEWCALIDGLPDDAMDATTIAAWPMADRPFADVVAWANIELTKNAAELGYARFLYAVARR